MVVRTAYVYVFFTEDSARFGHNYKKGMVGAPTRGRAADARQEKVAGEYVKAMQAMDRKYVGTPEGTVGPTERRLVHLVSVHASFKA